MEQRNIKTLQIGKNTATTALTAGDEVNTSVLLDGDIIPIDSKTGLAIEAATVATTDKIAFIQKGQSDYISNPIVKANLTSKNKKAYAAPTFWRKTIGYNGTTGTFPVVNDKSQSVTISSFATKDASEMFLGFRAVGTSFKHSSAVQYETCKEIADSLNINAKQNETYVFSAVLQAAVPAIAGDIVAVPAGTTFDVVKGSSFITFAGDPTDAVMIPGNTIVIPDTNWGDRATSYVIKNVNAATFTVELEGAYIGSDDTAIAIADARIVPAGSEATVTGACGILAEAITPPYVRNDKPLDVIRFTMEGDDTMSGSGVKITELAVGTLGSGDGRAVADMEFMTRGNQIMNASEDDKYAYIKEDAVLTQTYDIWSIEHADTSYTSTSVYSHSPIQTIIALPTTRTGGTTSAIAAAVLDAIVAL